MFEFKQVESARIFKLRLRAYKIHTHHHYNYWTIKIYQIDIKKHNHKI